jgi:hypothetical protein
MLTSIIGYDMAYDIRQGAQRAANLDPPIEVRYYPGFWGNEITIGDAMSENGWAHVGQHIPGVGENQRIFLRYRRAKTPQLFDALANAFDQMWTRSRPASSLTP